MIVLRSDSQDIGQKKTENKDCAGCGEIVKISP